jgi:hypothetical protein
LWCCQIDEEIKKLVTELTNKQTNVSTVQYPYRRRGIGLAGIGMFGPSGVSGKNDFLYMMLIGISRPDLVSTRLQGKGERERERERGRDGI